jgi:hypothetical protein
METETAAERRRPRAFLLIVLGIAVVGLVAYWMWPMPPATPSVPASSRPRTAKPGETEALSPEDLNVRLEALQAKRPELGDVERNPFRFRPLPAPEEPAKQDVVVPTAPPGPPPAPSIPPIPLRFMGTVEGPGIKLAALTDCKGFTYAGREGEIVDGRYKLVRIQAESIVMEYANGTGRTTIRKSGECGPGQGR